ncbi:hypothetical protein ABK040_011452 [Willaertia magna]
MKKFFYRNVFFKLNIHSSNNNSLNFINYNLKYKRTLLTKFKQKLNNIFGNDFQQQKIEPPKSPNSESSEKSYTLNISENNNLQNNLQKINDPYFNFKNFIPLDYLENEINYTNKFFNTLQKEKVEKKLKSLQKEYSVKNNNNLFFKYSENIFLTDIDFTNNFIYFSINYGEFLFRVNVDNTLQNSLQNFTQNDLQSDLEKFSQNNLKNFVNENFYFKICKLFEEKFILKKNLHENLQLIYNKKILNLEIEKFIKKKFGNVPKIDVTYSVILQKMSQCDNFFCNVIDINGETIAIISDLSKNRTLFIIEDIPNLANIEFEYLKNLDIFSFLFTTRDTKFRTNEISHRVYQHGIEKFTKILYNEKDDKFFVDIGKTKNGKFHYITINSKDTTEVYLLIPNLENNLQNNLQDSFNLFCLQKRKIGQQFFFEFHEETNTFFIVTNKEADGELELFTMKIENLSQLLSQKIVDNKNCDNIYFYNTPLSTLYPLQKIYTPQKNQSIFEIDLFSNYLILSIIDQSLPKLIKINLHTLQNSLQNDLQNIDNTLQIFENLEIFKDLHFIENKFNVDYNCKYFHIKGYSLLYKDSLQFIYNLETNEYFTIFGNLKNLETNLECEIVNVDNEIPIKIVKSKHYNQPVDNVTKNCNENCNENDTYCFLIGYGAYNTHLLEDLENYHNNNLFFYYRDYFLQQSLQQQHSHH